jgi:hypothetical protein
MLAIKDKQVWLYISLLFGGWIISIIYFDFQSFFAFALGIAIPLLQRLFSLDEAKRIEGFIKLGLLRVLEHRDSEEQYRDRIRSTKKKLYIMGHTAKRLIEDFADQNGRTEKKVLLEALSRDVKVRILVAKKEYLLESKQNDFLQTQVKMKKIKQQYSENFHVRYYDHIPAHSLFLFDNDCLIGPIFTEIESRDTPTLDMKYDSIFASKYIEHFDKEWEKAEELTVD